MVSRFIKNKDLTGINSDERIIEAVIKETSEPLTNTFKGVPVKQYSALGLSSQTDSVQGF